MGSRAVMAIFAKMGHEVAAMALGAALKSWGGNPSGPGAFLGCALLKMCSMSRAVGGIAASLST
eukprot:555092-Pyramimonas_sp.AAC.1